MTQFEIFDKHADPPSVLETDPCERKHGGNPESVEAFGRGKAKQREAVFRAINEAGEEGLTADELAAAWKVGVNAISGRFSELKAEGWITKIGTRRTRTGSSAGVFVDSIFAE